VALVRERTLREALTDASKEVGLEINVDRAKYVLLPCHLNARKNRGVNADNRSVENISQLRYLGTRVTEQNLIQEEIRRILNSGSA
jgi:hypothetical protein